ncbi:MAG: hypothetical protein ABEK50_11590 [bacterium]
MIDNPGPLAGMILSLLIPWGILEVNFHAETATVPVRLAFLIGVFTFPCFYLIYRHSFEQGIEWGLIGIALSFFTKIAIVSASGFLLWGILRINLLYFMPPLFYSLLSLHFFAIYFAGPKTSTAKEEFRYAE